MKAYAFKVKETKDQSGLFIGKVSDKGAFIVYVAVLGYAIQLAF